MSKRKSSESHTDSTSSYFNLGISDGDDTDTTVEKKTKSHDLSPLPLPLTETAKQSLLTIVVSQFIHPVHLFPSGILPLIIDYVPASPKLSKAISLCVTILN